MKWLSKLVRFAFLLEWGLIGIWRGLTIGLVLFFLTSFVFLTFFTDWKKEAQKAVLARSKQRDEDSGVSLEEFPDVEDAEDAEDDMASIRNASNVSFDVDRSESEEDH
jgi:hypothetical protein